MCAIAGVKPCVSTPSSVEGATPPPARKNPCCSASGGGTQTPPLFRAPYLLWGVRCTFHAGSPSLLFLGGPPPGGLPPPPPLVERVRVVVGYAMARLGGGPDIGRCQACWSCSPGDLWYSGRHPCPRPAGFITPLARTWWEMGRCTVRRQPRPLLLPPICVSVDSCHACCAGRPPPPPPSAVPASASSSAYDAASAASTCVGHCSVAPLTFGGLYPPPPWFLLPWRRWKMAPPSASAPQFLTKSPPPQMGGAG